MIEKLIMIYSFIKARYFGKYNPVFQSRLYKKQVNFLHKHAVFYQDNQELPLMNKQLLMTNFDKVNTVGIKKEEAINFALECERSRQFDRKLRGVTVGLSSGTSGSRGVFLVSNFERGLWAGTILAKMLPKGKLFGHKVAFFMRANSELYETIQSKLIAFKFYDLFLDMEQNFADLVTFEPTILVAPPSILLQFAKYNKQKINIPTVISIAEVLEAEDAVFIKKNLDLNVIHQVYQCTEGLLGVTCAYGILHLNETFIKFEKEKLDDRRFYPIITDLKRRAQPIIRYRLNDILVEKEVPCLCGSSELAIEKIEGRSDDIFVFDSVDRTENILVFPDFIRRCVLFSSNLKEYRVVQLTETEINIYLEASSTSIREQITKEFSLLAEHYHFNLPKLVFLAYTYDKQKKLRRIESHVQAN